MSLPPEEYPHTRRLVVFARRLLLAVVVLVTWIPLALGFGSGGEAFWLLFPIWVVIGAYVLKIIPKPRSPYKKAWLKWTVKGLLIVLPIAYCYGMAHYMMAKVVISEVLIAIWFFAASLELLLLYLFQIFEVINAKLTKGRSKAQAMVIYGVGKAIFYVLLAALLLPTMSIHRVKFAPNNHPEELELKYELVRFPSRGKPRVELTGWFFPLKDNKGTVLACHGAGANRADIALMIMLLQEAGFQVLSFDFRGHGQSEGHTVTFGYHERKDVLGAWDYLMTRDDVDPDQVYGFGVSMGASSLLLALPDMPEMKAVVADSAFSSLNLMVHHQYRFLPHPLDHVPAAFTRFIGRLDSGLRVDEVSPVEAIKDLDVPIFFIHGLDDITIPPECANILHDSYKGPKQLKLVPGAGHCQAAGMGPDYYRKGIQDFYLGVAKLEYIFYGWGAKSEPRENELYNSGDYEGLVAWMEDEFDRYDQYVADLGGLDEIKKSGKMFRGMACGFCELFVGLHYCVDYNAQFTPRSVEYFLMLVHQDTQPYTRELIRMFDEISKSDHPMLKAYGLWFLKQAECREFKVWDAEDMKSGQSYPRIEAFRDYVYQCANRGEAWSYGFAVDASRYDSRLPHVMDCLHRYHQAIAKEWWSRDVNHHIDWRLFSLADRPEEEFDRLNATQKSFIHHRLDCQLVTSGYRPNPGVPRMFEIMGRSSDVPAYLERLQVMEMLIQLSDSRNTDKDAILRENKNRMYLLERFMDQCLEKGDCGQFHPETLREIYDLMGRGDAFNQVFPRNSGIKR